MVFGSENTRSCPVRCSKVERSRTCQPKDVKDFGDVYVVGLRCFEMSVTKYLSFGFQYKLIFSQVKQVFTCIMLDMRLLTSECKHTHRCTLCSEAFVPNTSSKMVKLLRVSYTECVLCKIRMIVCLMLWLENEKTDKLKQHWCSVSRSQMSKRLLNQQTSLILLELLMPQ